MFQYNCPYCDEELKGSFGDNVYCKKCDKTYESNWDHTSKYSVNAWLTGKEHEGKVDVD